MKFAEMTFPELRRVPRDGCVVVAPIAAVEQHSLHLATLTDTVLMTGVADAAERLLPQTLLQLPTLWFGASHHHLRFGATLSARVETHVEMLIDLLQPLLEDGFQRLLILNGHGGNLDTMQMALRRLQPHWPQRILAAASYWDLAAPELAALCDGPRRQMGHACEMETSMMLALRPDLVRKDQIRDDPEQDDPVLRGLYLAEDMYQRTDHGAVGYPSRASVEKGRRLIDAAAFRVAEVVKRLLERPLPR
ncbi:MAG: creatininase family protein [Gemmataceae bacterium]